MAQQVPSSIFFVVRPTDNQKSAVADRLASVGTVEKLPGEDLLLLQTRQTASDPEAAWRDVRVALEETVSVQPVLVDETGELHYPTGEVTVRFYQPPTEEELQQLAAKYHLRLRNRNRFMPQQVVFNLADGNQCYLPILVEEIAGQDKVKTAWANTLSRYKRISP
jgi:hypothetical protein